AAPGQARALFAHPPRLRDDRGRNRVEHPHPLLPLPGVCRRRARVHRLPLAPGSGPYCLAARPLQDAQRAARDGQGPHPNGAHFARGGDPPAHRGAWGAADPAGLGAGVVPYRAGIDRRPELARSTAGSGWTVGVARVSWV
ncbi:MAG: hypothetical protein AVDCRST_MAG59-4138, partial [uncultured Thermomicrobiales bacterium]